MKREAKITSKPLPDQEAVILKLQEILATLDTTPLPVGELGRQLLDSLELTDRIRSRVRDRAKKLLLENPGIIPCWHVSETPVRTLSRDTAAIFTAMSKADDSLNHERFFEACVTSLGSLRSLLAERNPHLSSDEVERELNRVLADQIRYEKVTRLGRVKDRQFRLRLDEN